MEVPFGAAVGDVSPIFVLLEVPEAGEPIEYGNLKLPGVDAVVALDERVAEVVDGEALELGHHTKVEVQVVRVPCEGQTFA